ncbi:enoyl-ACP reductase FabI [Terasakiella sp. A23]|uniref:enoyl-ACP reductase FabI n=1 Tax=Terasakiella sp. FCG-A23 TaxID=3080561 RepID=UPI002953EF56|nr:enoyl-ACP reductase FabI [Terasakiella sp. A23]MDV7339096.1 enoyl-ACP reductase FabI [Terasakiella sp. A23]
MFSLEGKKGLIIGIANEHSIAYGAAKAVRAMGADVAITYVNEKGRPFVEPIVENLHAPLFMPCDVREEGQLKAVFEEIDAKWGRLDFVIHSIAFAPREDLHGRVVDSTREGFSLAMDVSCHSFIRIAKYAEPLMEKAGNGTLITISFYGSEKVVEHYNLMGPVKAALESSAKYLAAELGPKGISVHSVSPGPLLTRAASGIDRFDELMEAAKDKAPEKRLVTIDEIGALCGFLCSNEARSITGNTTYIDAGYHVMG